MYVLSVSSLKGGVGKTTVALGMASSAAASGLRTLVVDLDPQCDATTGLGAIGEFADTCADVLQSPRHNVVHRAIISSTWGKALSGAIDIMVGSPRVQIVDHPNPTVKEMWRLEEALSRVEKDYDLVIIDTPPSINGLTKTAWVASDRVLIVTEPSLFSVVAAERSIRSINALRKSVTRRLKIHGVVVNRFKPLNKEHQFRLNELREKYRHKVLDQIFEEKSTIQQAQGAARPIHGWSGETAESVAKKFDEILDGLMKDFQENPYVEVTSSSWWKARKAKKLNREQRGQGMDALLASEEHYPFDLLTGEATIPTASAKVDAADNQADSVQVGDKEEASSADVEDENTPPTPEELFEALMAEREQRGKED